MTRGQPDLYEVFKKVIEKYLKRRGERDKYFTKTDKLRPVEL